MKILKIILLTAASALVAVSCKSNLPKQPRFGVVSIDTLLDNAHAECRIAYRFASVLNAAASPSLEAIEAANIGYFFQLEEYAGTAEEAMQVSLCEIAETFLVQMAEAGGARYDLSTESMGKVIDTLVSYTISRRSCTGGAHGIYGIECHTYALNGGYEITTADLFGSEHLPALEKTIRQKIYTAYETQNDEQLTAFGFFPEYIAPTENFRISDEGITFYYNPYEIGCYALGSVEVTLSRDEMDALRNGK